MDAKGITPEGERERTGKAYEEIVLGKHIAGGTGSHRQAYGEYEDALKGKGCPRIPVRSVKFVKMPRTKDEPIATIRPAAASCRYISPGIRVSLATN